MPIPSDAQRLKHRCGRSCISIQMRFTHPLKISPSYNPPRPWRSSEESGITRRCVYFWLTCREGCRKVVLGNSSQVGQEIVLLIRIPGSIRLSHLTGRNLCTRSPLKTSPVYRTPFESTASICTPKNCPAFCPMLPIWPTILPSNRFRNQM